MEQAKTALLAGDGETACGLLTEHGREQSLAFRTDFERNVPKTCEEIVSGEQKHPDYWRRDVEAAKFSVVKLDNDRATVRLKAGPYVEADFELVKTDDGWRIDDAPTQVPSGN